MADYLKLTFQGHIPAKKNSSVMTWSGGRMRRVPSKAYQKWEKDELPTLTGAGSFSGPVSIKYEFHPGSLKKFDLSNSIEGINDMLVKAGIVEDDNWSIIRELHLFVGSFDRGNERCIVTIKSLLPDQLYDALTVLESKAEIRSIATKTNQSQKAVREYYESIARGQAA